MDDELVRELIAAVQTARDELFDSISVWKGDSIEDGRTVPDDEPDKERFDYLDNLINRATEALR